jgi:ribosomal-protein-alanine N-acetyltransferase
MTVVWLILDEAHIATIAVHPDFRGHGIGSLMLRTILEEAARKGAGEAMLEVRANNGIAQAMYRRFGFEVVFRRPRYYRDNNEDALLMSLDDLPGRLARWQSEDVANRGNMEGGSV